MPTKSSNSSGFTAIELVLIVALLAVIGIAAFFAYSHLPQSPAATSKKAENTNSSYLVVTQWGVKVKMTDAPKLSYAYDDKPSSTAAGPYDSIIGLQVDPQYLQNKDCKVSVAMSRVKTPEPANNGTKVGDYYYQVTGSPYGCDNAADDALYQRIRSEFSPANVSIGN